MATKDVVWRLLRARLDVGLSDAVSMYVGLINALLLALSIYVVIVIFFNVTSSVGGWGVHQMICLYGTFIVIRSFVQMIVLPSCEATARKIRDGTIEFYLLKPIDAQALLAVFEFRIWNIFGVALGLSIVAWASAASGNLSVEVSVLYLASLACAGIIVFSIWSCVASLAFWGNRISNVSMLLFSFLTIGRFPSGSYPDWMRIVVITVLPVYFIIEVPASTMTNFWSLRSLLGMLGAALLFLIASRQIWKAGVARYGRVGG